MHKLTILISIHYFIFNSVAVSCNKTDRETFCYLWILFCCRIYLCKC